MTCMSMSWDISLGEVITILNDQDSVIIMITKEKGGAALQCAHKKRNIAKYHILYIKKATVPTIINV